MNLDLSSACPGQEQSRADGWFEASQLMNGARLLKPVFDFDLEHCPNCGGELKIIAAILEQPVIEKIHSTWVCRRGHPLGRLPVARRCKQPDAAQP